MEELLRQRIGGLALGYEDLNDHDRLRLDPLAALMAGKEDVLGGDRLCEQDKGNNPRFIVTNLPAGGFAGDAADRYEAATLYEKFYCARGEMENRIKEAQQDLFADHTSTS